jgi:3-isopropylmalate/(R)-2-methylmalate dehydratase large subunit
VGMTMVEKILAKHAGLDHVVPGQIVEAQVDVVMLHDIGTPGIQRPFKELGAVKIADNVDCVIIPDHYVPAPTVQAAENLKLTRDFAKKMNVKHYYEVGHGGICHHIMIEKGHVLPGQIIVAPDSHATTYGACGALGTGLGVTDTAIALGTGNLWFQVPDTVKITLTGELGPFVSAKDVALFLLKQFGEEKLIYKCVEIVGPVVEELSIDSRACIANMMLEAGVKACLFVPDDKTIEFLQQLVEKVPEPVVADSDAHYEEVITFELSNLVPFVAAPHSPSNGKDISAVVGIKIHQAFLGSCTNGHLEDLRVAAGILKEQSIHPSVRMIVTPASQEIYQHAMAEGLIKVFIDAGALVTNPGCGVCLGGHLGVIASEEVCISSSNRNFRGRMGSVEGQIYLASPAVVAASAIAGEIADPRQWGGDESR